MRVFGFITPLPRLYFHRVFGGVSGFVSRVCANVLYDDVMLSSCHRHGVPDGNISITDLHA